MRRYGFYHRYDTPAELALLTRLWALVNDRLNYFTPTKKPIGYTTGANGSMTSPGPRSSGSWLPGC